MNEIDTSAERLTSEELLQKYTSEPCLWDSLATEKRPVVLYGTGNGADKIIKELERRGVAVSGVFASDGFVRERYFAGMRVESFDGIVSRLGGDIKVLMCFGSDREEVMTFAEKIDRTCDLSLPDVPLYGEGLFDTEYLYNNADKLSEVRAMLSDIESRALFDDTVMYRLTGKIKYLKRVEDVPSSYKKIFEGRTIKRIADLGAYKGDSTEILASVFGFGCVITAFEPDPKTFAKLCDGAVRIEEKYGVSVIPVNAAASDSEGETVFSTSSSRGAGAEGKNRRAKEKTVRCATVDGTASEGYDLIKLDVEGDEAKALAGASGTLKRDFPCLALSLYHRTADLFSLPLMIRSLGGKYGSAKYYLRRPKCLPAWDLTLFVRTEEASE